MTISRVVPSRSLQHDISILSCLVPSMSLKALEITIVCSPPLTTQRVYSEAGEVWWSQEQLEEMRQREHARLMALRRSGGHGSGSTIEPGRRQLHDSHNRRVVRILPKTGPRGVASYHAHNASPRRQSFPLPNYTSYGYIP